MTLFFLLILAHVLGDFLFQSDSWVKKKQANKIAAKELYFHVGIHLGLSLLLTIPFYSGPQFIAAIALLALSHWAIDLAKLHLEGKGHDVKVFIIDQLLHIAVIAGIANHFQNFSGQLGEVISPDLALLSFLCFCLLTFVSSIVIKTLISRWSPIAVDEDLTVCENCQCETCHQKRSKIVAKRTDKDESLPSAGSYIGMLERLFVFGFVITGNLSGIGILIGVKSVFRFGDLRDSDGRKLTEYILIGSLLSFGIAILIGYLFLFTRSLLSI